MSSKRTPTIQISHALWDLCCALTIAGTWPRFIEPNLIATTSIALKIPHLPKPLRGLKILQFSDLHLNPRISDRFLNKLIAKVRALEPDLIVFTGDFLCYSQLLEEERLLNFLNAFQAPYGCFAVLGNHDYDQCVSINDNGDYDILSTNIPMAKRCIQRLFNSTVLTKQATPRAKAIRTHEGLLALLKKTPFKLLNNDTQQVSIRGAKLNICGLGEHMIGQTQPVQAFKNYDRHCPGIVLLHNPDGIPLLKDYPGEIILCGHTHGGQVNLPWIWKRFTLLENMQFKQGLLRFQNKWVYVSKGIGGVIQLRLNAMPEIVLITLEEEL